MKTINLLAVACALVSVTSAPTSTAAVNTEPVIAVGLLGSYSELEFKGPSNDIERMPEGGVFLNYGNKLTGHAGLVFQAEISGQYSENQGQRVKDLQADLDLGWRLALDASNFLDMLVGAGYKWNRFDPGYNKYDIELTNRTPSPKLRLAITISSMLPPCALKPAREDPWRAMRNWMSRVFPIRPWTCRAAPTLMSN